MSFDEAIKELEGHESNIRFSRLLTMLWNRMKGEHYPFVAVHSRPPGVGN
jgi:hypothetical protein